MCDVLNMSSRIRGEILLAQVNMAESDNSIKCHLHFSFCLSDMKNRDNFCTNMILQLSEKLLIIIVTLSAFLFFNLLL